MECGEVQRRMAGVLARSADRRERLEVESHAARCARCAIAYGDLIAASVALDRAYAPLRTTTVTLSPARVRLALRQQRPLPAAVRLGRLTARFTEVALAAAVTAFAFVGSASVAPKPAIVEETSADVTPGATATHPVDADAIVRWFRIGRYSSSPDLVEPAVPLPSHEDAQTLPGLHDRVGLQR